MTTQLKNRKEGEAPNTISRYYAWVLRRGILVSMLSWWREVLIFKACFEKKKETWGQGARDGQGEACQMLLSSRSQRTKAPNVS